MRESRKSFRKLAKSSGPVAVKYSKKPTEAHEFNFKTKGRERMKIRGQQHPAAVHPNQFPMTLRSSTKGENFHPMIVSSLEPKGKGGRGWRGEGSKHYCTMFFRETSGCVRLLPMQGAWLWVCVYCYPMQTLVACVLRYIYYLVSAMNSLSLLCSLPPSLPHQTE